MSRARTLADLLDSSGDVKSTNLDNVAITNLSSTASGIDVTGEVQASSFVMDDSNNTDRWELLRSGNDFTIYNDYPSQSERFRITSGGNVGIGTTENALFNVVGGVTRLAVTGSSSSTSITGNTSASIAIINTDQTQNNTAGLHFARADTDDTPNYAGASVVAQFEDSQVTGQYPKTSLSFLTSTAANNAPSTKMTISSTGNVGIGTSSPLGKIHSKEGTSGVTSISSNFDQLVLEDDLHSGMHILSGASQDGAIYFGSTNGSSQGQLKYFHASDSFSIYTNDSERLKISSTGNVGIGLGSATVNARFHSNGSALVGSGSLNSTIGNNLTTGGLDIAVGNGTKAFQIWDDNSTGTPRLTVMRNGNMGLGVAPKAWQTARNVLQIGTQGSISGNNTALGTVEYANNYYVATDNISKRINADEVTMYEQHYTGKHIFKVAPSGTADSAISWTTAMTIANDGVVSTVGDFQPGGDIQLANGRGISFAAMPNASGMTSELLDDYEEGTWTPYISNSANTTSTSFGSVSYAQYTKVGDMVTVFMRAVNINTTGYSSNEGVYLRGFPFSQSGYSFGACYLRSLTPSGIGIVNGYMAPTKMYFTMADNSTVTFANIINNGSDVFLTFTYKT